MVVIRSLDCSDGSYLNYQDEDQLDNQNKSQLILHYYIISSIPTSYHQQSSHEIMNGDEITTSSTDIKCWTLFNVLPSSQIFSGSKWLNNVYIPLTQKAQTAVSQCLVYTIMITKNRK